MVGVLISIWSVVGDSWSVAHGRWSVVGGWSVGGGFVLRRFNPQVNLFTMNSIEIIHAPREIG